MRCRLNRLNLNKWLSSYLRSKLFATNCWFINVSDLFIVNDNCFCLNDVFNRSEYWKSNAKKYCDYCKTWIADNKAVNIYEYLILQNNQSIPIVFVKSIAIHESGKNHKEKVNEKLKEVNDK